MPSYIICTRYSYRNTSSQYSQRRLALIVFISIHFICLEINYNKNKIKTKRIKKEPPTLSYKIQQMTCSVYVYAYHLNIYCEREPEHIQLF